MTLVLLHTLKWEISSWHFTNSLSKFSKFSFSQWKIFPNINSKPLNSFECAEITITVSVQNIIQNNNNKGIHRKHAHTFLALQGMKWTTPCIHWVYINTPSHLSHWRDDTQSLKLKARSRARKVLLHSNVYTYYWNRIGYVCSACV